MTKPAPAAPALVLYAPALNEPANCGAIDEAAQRITRSLDHISQPVGVRYAVREAAPAKYGSECAAEVREIVQLKEGESEDEGIVTHRIYHLDYLPGLDLEEHPNVLVATVRVFWLWFTMALRFVGALFSAESLSKTQKTAVVVGGFGLGSLTVYVMFVIAALAHAVLNVVEGAPVAGAATDQSSLLAAAETAVDDFLSSTWPKAIAIAGVFSLSLGSVRAQLEKTVKTYLRFGRYMENADTRATCTGKFNELLEYLLSQKSSRVDIVAYSMGSMVTLDALFPADGQPAPRAASVTTLTTIGCPFDLVRTFWPDYFSGRDVSESKLKWYNVFSPVDLLGSNFANADGVVESKRGINDANPNAPDASKEDDKKKPRPECNLFYDPMGRRKLGFWTAVLGGAYRAHSQYWVPGQPAAESCYKRFIPLVYPPASAR